MEKTSNLKQKTSPVMEKQTWSMFFEEYINDEEIDIFVQKIRFLFW